MCYGLAPHIAGWKAPRILRRIEPDGDWDFEISQSNDEWPPRLIIRGAFRGGCNGLPSSGRLREYCYRGAGEGVQADVPVHDHVLPIARAFKTAAMRAGVGP
jgi:hypothetical protein